MLSRVGRAVVAGGLGFLLLRLPALPATLEQLGSPHFPTALAAAAEAVALAVCAWTVLVGGIGAAGAAVAPAGRLTRLAGRLLPQALLAAGAVALVAVPAQADDSRSGAADRPVRALLDGLPLPERPVAADPPAPAPVHVVRTGESLWSIATDRLGPGASAEQVAALVAGLHRANADRIGADPDLIHPGQRLAVPATTTKDQP